MSFVCPVCGYPNLAEPPYDGTSPSYEICPSCGTEFGYEDSGRSHAELRHAWVDGGCRWWATYDKPPKGWDPLQQLRGLERKTRTERK